MFLGSSHKLPQLHEVIKDQLPKPKSLYGAYKEIIPAIMKQTKNPDYHIQVQLPDVQELPLTLPEYNKNYLNFV